MDGVKIFRLKSSKFECTRRKLHTLPNATPSPGSFIPPVVIPRRWWSVEALRNAFMRIDRSAMQKCIDTTLNFIRLRALSRMFARRHSKCTKTRADLDDVIEWAETCMWSFFWNLDANRAGQTPDDPPRVPFGFWTSNECCGRWRSMRIRLSYLNCICSVWCVD